MTHQFRRDQITKAMTDHFIPDATDEIGRHAIIHEGIDWVTNTPTLAVRCSGGYIVAYNSSDPGYYSEINVDFIADDGRTMQLAVIGKDEGNDESYKPFPEYEPMHVYPYNGKTMDVVDDNITYVAVSDESYWYND